MFQEPSSAALVAAEEILRSRGGSARNYPNASSFWRLTKRDAGVGSGGTAVAGLEVDHRRKEELEPRLVPGGAGRRSGENRCGYGRAAGPETYRWLLVRKQEDPQGTPEWETLPVNSSGSLAERASRRLINDGNLLPQMSGVELKRRP